MDIKIPEVGESVREALLATWYKNDGESVQQDDVLCEVETDKITLEVAAEGSGVLRHVVSAGATVPVGTVIGRIDVAASATTHQPTISDSQAAVSPGAPPVATSPAIRRMMQEHAIDPASVSISGNSNRMTLNDLFARIEGQGGVTTSQEPSGSVPAVGLSGLFANIDGVAPAIPQESPVVKSEAAPIYRAGTVERRPMSPLRKRVAERLLAATQQTAMLTTFNEVDLKSVMALRDAHQEQFQQRHGVKLGYMSFFIKATVLALMDYPAVNGSIDGDDLVFHHEYNIGVAVGGDKGLVVPVIRNADRMKLHEIEQSIQRFVENVATNKLTIADLEGGTFSISNGGVYGSMLSTPILNPPQSAILGLHAIQDRPVARDGQVVIRPMMYLALSYDHRMIDGREAVRFLKRIKELLEDPEQLLLEG